MAQSSKLMETLLSRGSVRTLGEIAGANDAQVQDALNVALPILVDNMRKNATSFSGEMALSSAFSDHAKNDITDVAAFLKRSDDEEGGKVLTHILGGEKYAVESDIAKKTGLTYDQSGKILAVMAPLVLSILGNIQKEKREEGRNSGIKDVLDSAMGDNGIGSSAKEGSFSDRIKGGLGTLFGVMKRASSAETREKQTQTATSMITEPSPVKIAEKKAKAIKAPEGAKKPASKKTATKKSTTKKPLEKTTKKATVKKAVEKKATAKKTAKKPVVKTSKKKAAVKKSTGGKVAAKKPSMKVSTKKPDKKSAPKKATTKKAIAKKATTKKAIAKKAIAKKAIAKKATAKKATAKKAIAKKATAKKATAKKATAKKATAKKATAKKAAVRKAPKKKL